MPDIATATVAVVPPGKGYVGDQFSVNVTTTAASEKVVLDIEGKQLAMSGSGTQWQYVAKIDKIGTSNFTVVASNKDGARGQAKEGVITTQKIPAKPVNVLAAKVSPQRGQVGKKLHLQCQDRPSGQGGHGGHGQGPLPHDRQRNRLESQA